MTLRGAIGRMKKGRRINRINTDVFRFYQLVSVSNLLNFQGRDREHRDYGRLAVANPIFLSFKKV